MRKLFYVAEYPLLDFENSSLRTEQVPQELKTTLIVPIQKKYIAGLKHPEKCRPTNVLCVIDKVLEVIVRVCEHLRRYFGENGIIYRGQ